jgi:hypothetical protein
MLRESPSQHFQAELGKVCPYCRRDLSELSSAGFQNHLEFCKIVVRIPNKVNR